MKCESCVGNPSPEATVLLISKGDRKLLICDECVDGFFLTTKYWIRAPEYWIRAPEEEFIIYLVHNA